MKTIRPAIEAPLRRFKKKKQKYLLRAIKHNEVKKVLQLLKQGCSPSEGYKSRYPLDTAIKYRNIEIISILLQQGSSISKPIHSSGWSLLRRVTVLRNTPISDKVHLVLNFIFRRKYFKTNDIFNEEQKIIAILQIFLNARMDVNMKLNSGNTPLYLSVKNQLRKVAEYLIEYGANLNVCDFVKGDTLAHLLVKEQYKEILNVDTVESRRNFEEQDYAEFLDYLITKGVDVDRKNNKGELPLQLALEYGLQRTFEVLLKYAKNVNFTDDCNRTILHIIMEMCDSDKIRNTKKISECLIEKVIKLSLDKGASVDIKDDNGNTPLHIAAEKKMFKCVLTMLEKCTNIDACNNNSETVLHILSRFTNYEDDIADIIQALILKGIDMNKINKDNMTAVQLATVHKNEGMLKLLKNQAADFHVRTICGESLFHLAIKLNDEQTFEPEEEDSIVNVLEILLDAGLDVNINMINGETPFYLAVKNKMRKVIELLIRKGADLDVCNRDGNSVAHYLVKEEFKFTSSIYDNGIPSDNKVSCKVQQNLDFMDWLLSKGLNVDLKNDYGQSPLQLAVKYNLLKVIMIFLKYANDVNFINEGKLSILHMIIQSSSDDSDNVSALEPNTVKFEVKNIVQTLLEKGVSVDIKDTFKNTALHIAAQQTRPDFISILLKYTKNVNVTNELGWTPLHFACELGNVEIVKKLIDNGADVNIIEDITGLTQLFVAVYNDNEDVIELLIEAGADLNAKDDTGQTVLHMVDSMKSSMNTLLRLGADVDAKDNLDRVPLYYAIVRQDDAAIGQLLDFGANVSKNTLSYFVLRELLASDNVMGHHAKLMAAQLSIPKIYTSIVFRKYVFYYKKCLDEVEKMRACKIDDNTTLYDFLHMNPKRRQAYESKRKFQDVMKLSSLTKQFPHYCDIIFAKRQEAHKKKSLIVSATYAWGKLTNILLPDICLAKIFNNVDRMTLEGLSVGPKTMKRPASSRLDFNPMKRRRLM